MRLLYAASCSLLALQLVFGTAQARSFEDERAAANACLAEVNSDSTLELSSTLTAANPTLEHMTDAKLPTEQDAQRIRAASPRVKKCRGMMLDAVKEFHPFLLPAYEILYWQRDLVYAQLVERRITFGNANRLLNEAFLEFRQREVRYMEAQSERARLEEAERNRSFAEQARQTQQAIRDSYTPPRFYTCYWQGSVLTCM